MVQYKEARTLVLGPHASLQFEDHQTMKYQIQEMLRAERIFDKEGIQEEINTYNELVPTGSNWKATLFLEFTDVAQRHQELSRLVGIEDRFFVQIDDRDPIAIHANDDMGRSNETKTAAIHFLRFEFSKDDVEFMRQGARVKIGIDDARLPYEAQLTSELLAELLDDFN